MSDNDSAAFIGRTIAGKFVVEALIGVGGSGTVYRAVQPALDRTVALKVLRDEVAGDPRFVERFKREARAASRLNHPSSVGVLDFGLHEGSLLYLAMEYVEGRTLYDVIRDEGPLAEARAVEILSQVLSAVAVAHNLEVIHRDLKPDNIIIVAARGDDGETTELAKVCDFGIASLGTVVREGDSTEMAGPSITSHGLLIGTPAYMSPEQARGDPAEKRSDLYSAGVVLYHMLAGRVPFDGDNAAHVVLKQINDEPVPLSKLAPINPALEAVCMKALCKEPQRRFATAREMRAALRATVGRPAGSDTLIAPASGPTLAHDSGASLPAAVTTDGPKPSTPRRQPAVLAALVVGGVLLGFFATKGLRRRPRPIAAAPTAVAASPAPPRESPPPEAPPAREPEPPLAAAPTAAAVLPVTSAVDPDEAPRRINRVVRRSGTARKTRAAPVAADPPLSASPAPAETPAPPPAPVVAPPPPPAPAATPAPPPAATKAPTRPVARPPDLGKARVSVVSIITSSGIPASKIRAAVSRIGALGCYRDALRAVGREAGGTATLHLKIDVTGYVSRATVAGASFLPGLGPCLEKAARGARVRDVDTGDGTADVVLSFTAAP